MRSSCTTSRSFPESSGFGSVFPGGSLPGLVRKGLSGQRKGGAFQVDRWACCPASLPRAMSGMSQPPSSPPPSSFQGTVETLGLTILSLGAALSQLPASAAPPPPTLPRLAPRFSCPGRPRPGEQVASGLGQRLSPAAGRPASGKCL